MSKTMYSCPVCGAFYSYYIALLVHVASHSKKK